MSKPIVCYWPDYTGVIAPQQDIAQDSNILLVGPATSFQYDSIIRSVDIVSPDANAGIQYEITGYGCTVDLVSTPDVAIPTSPLQNIVETINAGAVNTRSSSTNIYQRIDSIKVLNGNATNVTVNYGGFGITSYVHYDYNRNAFSFFTSYIQMISNTGLWGSIYISPNNPESATTNGNLLPFGYVNGVNVLPPGTFIPAFQLVAPSHDNQLGLFPGPPIMYSVIWASVTNCTTDSMFFTFIQQGIS